jgi:hypothetical protein
MTRPLQTTGRLICWRFLSAKGLDSQPGGGVYLVVFSPIVEGKNFHSVAFGPITLSQTILNVLAPAQATCEDQMGLALESAHVR